MDACFLPGAQIGPCLCFLGQACVEKFRWEKCQLNVGAEHYFKNALDLCVCIIMQNTAYCREIISPEVHVCVHADPH